jgi:hypothetical protein
MARSARRLSVCRLPPSNRRDDLGFRIVLEQYEWPFSIVICAAFPQSLRPAQRFFSPCAETFALVSRHGHLKKLCFVVRGLAYKRRIYL